jgi:phage tail-like protein
VSAYLEHLPAVLTEADERGVLADLLAAFEAVLTGSPEAYVDAAGDVHAAGIEQILDGAPGFAGVERYFDPGPEAEPAQRAPDRFLDWLSGWVALTLRADLGPEARRAFIARAVSLYGQRGTKAGLMQMIRAYTSTEVEIEEFTPELQLGVRSTVGVDTTIGGGAPHAFQVIVRLPRVDERQFREQRAIVAAIIDAEKPAHTHYSLEILTPSLRIGVTSTIGVDTLIGEPPSDLSPS